ncbi:MAG: hypothetical protein K2L52_04095 [Clostridia bacterium]|nr:hypothetical protein [Clostridia bacterium]
MTKLTKKSKVKIAVSVIVAVVLIFSITMFSIWATTEVYCKKVDYDTLQNKLGDYFIVPSGLEGEVNKTSNNEMSCRVYFPKPDEDSNHRYGKYTNLTLKYKYATGYIMDLGRQDVSASISATKGEDITQLVDGYDVQKVEGVDVYYNQHSNVESSHATSVSAEVSIYFVLDGVIYNINTRTGVTSYDSDTSEIDDNLEFAREKVNEYARYLFDKMFIVE